MIKIFEKFNEPKVREEYYNNGQKKSEKWSLNGKLHREDGPADQFWFDNGQKGFEHWALNGKDHREDGTAFQTWGTNGQKIDEIWSLNNKDYSRKKWVKELKKIGSKHYEEQQMLLDMEKYNL